MPKFSNRTAIETIAHTVTFQEDTASLHTDSGVFVVPSTTLTSRMEEDEQFPYIIEYDTATRVLSGITGPDGTIYYRINDDQVKIASRTPEHLSRLRSGGIDIDIVDAVQVMMDELFPVYLERLKKLPKDYMDLYYLYELKISYLASTPKNTYIFDPTPSELAHALALSMAGSSDYPPLILKAF